MFQEDRWLKENRIFPAANPFVVLVSRQFLETGQKIRTLVVIYIV